MPKNSRALPRSFWLGSSLALGILGLALLMGVLRKIPAPPAPLPVIGSVADFQLTNQFGQAVSLADFSNRVWVANIVFTRCAGPCPRLAQQMSHIQKALPASSRAQLVTLTTDPEFDTPERLKKFGAFHGADFSRWSLLTGDKLQIGQLAANSLKMSAQPVPVADQRDAADLFIHTTMFMIVDQRARLRGYFETGGEGVDWTNAVLPKILATIKQLENEP